MVKNVQNSKAGFSLVELLVAVMFIGILMAGMANVFKSSISTFTTSSEGISSARRNRMSFDLLYDDLNTAGMYLTDLTAPPINVSLTNPVFYILPNMPIAGATADDPQNADELFFYLDQPLPFEGTLSGTGGANLAFTARSAGELANAGVAAAVADNTFSVDCGDPSYANLVKVGMSFVIKDSWDIMTIDQINGVAGSVVTIHVAANASSAITGVGSSGAPSKASHIHNSSVMFYQPAQMVHYYVAMKLYDPQKAAGIPCLIRDQAPYSTTGWAGLAAGSIASSVVAENVSGFKAYLSANSGAAWVGYGKSYTGFASGWTSGMRTDLDTQLAASGRADFTTTQGNENWIRDIPVLVRLDITTRTTTKRAEYSATPLATAAYKDFTQSLVIVPRHFGLSMK
ncbi:MAG TPA: prepilin-type N-terminal cleavage/methylation domain-containing protein [Geothrix sp.]|nr:prepilin-type N-terminal cleavage/methylation domain-containing protein [Geothrix sp.]